MIADLEKQISELTQEKTNLETEIKTSKDAEATVRWLYDTNCIFRKMGLTIQKDYQSNILKLIIDKINNKLCKIDKYQNKRNETTTFKIKGYSGHNYIYCNDLSPTFYSAFLSLNWLVILFRGRIICNKGYLLFLQ